MELKKIGIAGASAIVAGNMMGSGIALLPASLASIGSVTVISWLFSIMGALSLAFVFSRLGLIDPQEGGPVAYAKETSRLLGHQTGLLYWLANWIGNLAIAITGVEYMSYFFPSLTQPLIGGSFAILSVWFFAMINLFGVSHIAKIIFTSLILMTIPVAGTAIFGWFYFSKAQFLQNWNVTAASNSHAVLSGLLLTIWSFVGIESATVEAGIVKNPKVTIPRATMIGTIFAGLIYLGSTTVISGMFPAAEISASGAPFGKAFGVIVGSWSEPMVSLLTAIASFSSLGSWMMLVSRAGITAAKQGTLPKIFGRLNAKGVPAHGLLITSTLMTLFMILLMIQGYIDHTTSTKMFSYIISTAVLVTVIPYFYSCLHLIRIDTKGKKANVRLVITILAALFCFVPFLGSKREEMIGTVIASYACFLFYCFEARSRK